MTEQDFLKILAEYEWVYREFPLPVLLCDDELTVRWSNGPAQSLYPHIADSRGLREALGEFSPGGLFRKLKSEGSCRLDGVFPFSGMQLAFTPILRDGEVSGVAVMLVNPQPGPGDMARMSKTPAALEKNIRESVEEMFHTMDAAALKADMMDAGWIKPAFQSISLSGYHLLRVANNITKYAQYQSQPPLITCQPVDMTEMLKELKPTVRGLCGAAGVPVRFLLPEEEAITQLDAEKFQFAFFNILHNAVYYTRPGNTVDIILEKMDQEIMVAVRDYGRGIPQDILPDVFRPYYAHGYDGKSAGIGLGLCLAKIVIEAQGGKIMISSRENEGTTVTLLLPQNTFSRPLAFAQGVASGKNFDRFSQAYIGLSDLVNGPYRD